MEPWTADQIPKSLKKLLSEDYSFTIPAKPKKESVSNYDGTVKFLVELEDGALVESVLMPEKNRITVCLSSQVGCAQACSFCYTGRMGLKRQLTAGEIVGQVQMANKWLLDHPEWKKERGYDMKQRVTNVVFMGMGEPLDNTDNVVKALKIFTETYGLQMARKTFCFYSRTFGWHKTTSRRLSWSCPSPSLFMQQLKEKEVS